MMAQAQSIPDAMTWTNRIHYNPIPTLLASKSEALRFFTRRDLLESDHGPVSQLWHSPHVIRLLETQGENGGWRYHGGREKIRSQEDYDQIETFRVLRYLVEKYGFNKSHRAFRNAAEFLFSHQTSQGDFRGIAGNQYVPYYSAAMMELLIKGGLSDNAGIERGFRWLLSIRQDDGGWAFPMRTVGRSLSTETFRSETLEPDRSKPFSHMVTGIVLRAFAAHPSYRKSREAKLAGELLASRLFEPDKYPDRQASSFWTSFSFPFWFTDLLSALDSLSLIGVNTSNAQVAGSVNWFVSNQAKNGLWSLRLRIMAGEKEPDNWITLAISRVFKRLFD